LKEYVKDSEDLQKAAIYDMFIFPHGDTYFLSIVNYLDLIVLSFEFDAETKNIKFKFEETIKLTELGINKLEKLCKLCSQTSLNSFIFIKNGFYIFTNTKAARHGVANSLSRKYRTKRY
jgi:hypothetical protein